MKHTIVIVTIIATNYFIYAHNQSIIVDEYDMRDDCQAKINAKTARIQKVVDNYNAKDQEP